MMLSLVHKATFLSSLLSVSSILNNYCLIFLVAPVLLRRAYKETFLEPR